MPSRKSLVKEYIRSGLQAFGRGQPDLARSSFQKVVDLEPHNARARVYLGTALLELGEAVQAVAHLERGVRAMGREPDVLGNLAQAYVALGRLDDARAAFQEASRLEPGEPRYPLGAATSLAMQQRFDEAARLLETLVRQHPNHPLIWYNLGNVRRDQGDLDAACQCFARVLQIEPAFAEAHNSLGAALHALHRLEDAERAYRACLAAVSDHLPAQLNLASVLIDVGRFGAAEAVCRSLLDKAPRTAMAHSHLGAALEHQGKLTQALDHKAQAARLAPADSKFAENHAVGLARLGRLDAAWTEFARCLALQPDAKSARARRADVLLACGRLDEGWADYACRPAALRFDAAHPVVRRSTALPDRLDGAVIHLLPEQGLGDELFFLRFVPLLAAEGARVRYRASPSLHPLLAHANCGAEIVQEFPPAADATVMLIGDLPHALARLGSGETCGYTSGVAHAAAVRDADQSRKYPAPLGLRARDALIAATRERLHAMGPAPYIAVTWTGGTPPTEQQLTGSWLLYKTVDVERLAGALREVPGTVISVQRNPRPQDSEAFAAALGRRLHDCSALNEDLEAMLALLALVDEYVGVSNTNMHLRAGAGRSARVLVPGPAEWRWQLSGDRSPWFPAFAVYRQSLDGDWSEALNALARDLRSREMHRG